MFESQKRQFVTKQKTVSEVVNAFLDRCQQRQHLKAFTYVDATGVAAQAQEANKRYEAGLARPLEGLVVAVKDNISMTSMPLTCSSNMLKGFTPVYNATVIEKLSDAGAVFIGKTNMDEFAMGSSTEHSALGGTLHPIDETRVPGGSSGGSAVAVADQQCHVALGSDTGGSVRQPAAFCGVYGFKPTYGRVSRHGLVAFASSLDQIGIFANSAADVASTFDVIAGADPMDSTSHPNAAARSVDALQCPLPKQFTVGVISDELLDGCDEEIKIAYKQFVRSLEELGATAVEVSLPNSEIWVPTYFILAGAEASSNLARYDGVRYGHRTSNDTSDVDFTTLSRTEGFGKEVKRRIMLGTYVLSSGYYDAYYKKAQQARRLVANAYDSIFSSVDVLAMPTTPTTAFVRGEITDPVQMWLSDLYTVSANLAGIPAISVPVGTDSKGLPIGMQLQGKKFADELVLQVAAAVAQ